MRKSNRSQRTAMATQFTGPIQPKDVTDLEIAFPASVSHLMPSYADIPDEFRNGHTKWNDLFSKWFYGGLKGARFTPKQGIDQTKALRHIRTVMGSFEPKHEHKEAAIAYLLSLWFDDVSY